MGPFFPEFVTSMFLAYECNYFVHNRQVYKHIQILCKAFSYMKWTMIIIKMINEMIGTKTITVTSSFETFQKECGNQCSFCSVSRPSVKPWTKSIYDTQ